MKRQLSALDRLVIAAALPSMNILRIASAVKDTETITLGTKVFEFYTGKAVTAGRIPIDLSAAPTAVAANITGTFAANLTDGDTITVGGVAATCRATLTGAANEFLLGADLTATRNNYVALINGGAGAGTVYTSASVAHPNVTAAASSTNAVVITARAKGTNGNAITLAESAAQFSWAGAATTLANGVDPTAAEAKAAIILAINANAAGFKATSGGTNEIILQGTDANGKSLATTTTMAGSNNVFAAAASFGGTAQGNDFPITKIVQRAALATEVALGVMRFPFNFNPTYASVVLKSSTGAHKAWDGVPAISGNTVSVDNAGTSDWAAGDLIIVTAGR